MHKIACQCMIVPVGRPSDSSSEHPCRKSDILQLSDDRATLHSGIFETSSDEGAWGPSGIGG
jgi:hypothetical protein